MGRALRKRQRAPGTRRAWEDARRAFEREGISLCYNDDIRRDYDPDRSNILLALESPTLVRANGWLEDEMEFDAEISFGDYYGLEHFYPCTDLYATNDNFVALEMVRPFNEKDRLVSYIYSFKNDLPEYRFRHEIAAEFGDRVDGFGSGTGRVLASKSDSLDRYMFQVVVENGRYDLYVSEKFFDCVKTLTIPIYYGGRQGVVDMGFDPDGVLFFSTKEELDEILSRRVGPSEYAELRPIAEANRRVLRELRNDIKARMFLSAVVPNYCHTVASYAAQATTGRNLGFD